MKMIETKSADKIHHDISYMISSGVTYIDALVEYSKKHDVEIETLAEIVKKSTIMKEKIRTEAVEMKLVKADKNVNKLC